VGSDRSDADAYQNRQYLNGSIPNIISTYSALETDKVLLFFHSTADCVKIANELSKSSLRGLPTNIHFAETDMTDTVLESCINKGVGYHHTKLSIEDREQVEALYNAGKIYYQSTTLKSLKDYQIYHYSLRGINTCHHESGHRTGPADNSWNQCLVLRKKMVWRTIL
jgi:hypothetical protein